MSLRRPAAAALAGAALLAAAACGGSDEPDARFELIVPDNNIRTEGAECAGARPFRYVHAGAPYTVEAGDGEVVAEGELPAGRARNADPSIDWGVDRIPTFCIMEFEVDDLPEHPSYRLVVEDGPPLEFDASLLGGDEPVMLVAQ